MRDAALWLGESFKIANPSSLEKHGPTGRWTLPTGRAEAASR